MVRARRWLTGEACGAVAVIVGSLREDSWTRKVARSLVELAPEALQLHFIEMRDLPVYDPDREPGCSSFLDGVSSCRSRMFPKKFMIAFGLWVELQRARPA